MIRGLRLCVILDAVAFGDSIDTAPSVDPAAWIAASIGGAPGTVGALVPARYASVLRLHPPEPGDGWWDRYRDLFTSVASVGAGHTSSPDLAWFAIWEGHGFERVSTHIAWAHPPVDDAERRWREGERQRLRADDDERASTIVRALASIPKFELPHRAYYLTHGPLSAVEDIRHPGDEGWRNPDLFWPDDRAWFAATDVDFWSLYVGGTHDFTDELSKQLTTPNELASADDRLPTED